MYVQNQEETMFFLSDSEVGGFFLRNIFAGLLSYLILLLSWRKISAWFPQLCRRCLKGHKWRSQHDKILRRTPFTGVEPFLLAPVQPLQTRRGCCSWLSPFFVLDLRGFLWGKKNITFFLESLCLKSNFFLSLLFRNQRESCLTIQSWQEYLACFNIFLKAPREALLSFARARPSVATNS